MKPEAIALAAHIDALCKKHEIGVHYYTGGRGWAWDDDRRIRTPLVNGDSSYALALHEIGHLLGKWQTRKSELVSETGAWLWAETNALRWTTPMRKLASRCLISYWGHALKRDHELPPAGHEFWRLVGK